MKKYVFGLLTGFLLMGIGLTVFALVNANDIKYKDTTVQGALDDLYGAQQYKRVCKLISEKYGTKGNIGSEYECKVSDTETHNFYILADNGNSYIMIMDRNITEGASTTTMSWNDAMKYIESSNLKTKWTNVLDIDLPKAQDIANAVGNNTWKAADSNTWWCLETKKQDIRSFPYCNNFTQNTLWLWDYTRSCINCEHSLSSPEADGYWTRDLITDGINAWLVDKSGPLGLLTATSTTYAGVRPTITVLKTNLYE